MATIRNSQATDNLIKGLSLDTARDKIPREIASKVVPTFNINNSLTYEAYSAVVSNATNANIFTIPDKTNFFVVGAQLSVIKDGGSTSTSSDINATINGTAKQLLRIGGLTGTAQTDSVSISFPYPIKVDSGSTITVNNTTSAANVKATAVIFGYRVDII